MLSHRRVDHMAPHHILPFAGDHLQRQLGRQPKAPRSTHTYTHPHTRAWPCQCFMTLPWRGRIPEEEDGGGGDQRTTNLTGGEMAILSASTRAPLNVCPEMLNSTYAGRRWATTWMLKVREVVQRSVTHGNAARAVQTTRLIVPNSRGGCEAQSECADNEALCSNISCTSKAARKDVWGGT
jgi:hypothetical protein